jgi:hypothetical protein
LKITHIQVKNLTFAINLVNFLLWTSAELWRSKDGSQINSQ